MPGFGGSGCRDSAVGCTFGADGECGSAARYFCGTIHCVRAAVPAGEFGAIEIGLSLEVIPGSESGERRIWGG